MKICFIIRSLEKGGAERQLSLLARLLKDKGHTITVGVFYSGGVFEQDLRRENILVHHLEKKSRWDVFGFFTRYIRWLKSEKPDILHSYLGISNILAVLARPFLKSTRIIWGIRASNMDLKKYDWLSRLAYKIESFLSRFAHRIIANSEAGRAYAVANGFDGAKIDIVHNGIDTMLFSKGTPGRSLKCELGLDESTVIIGMVARVDPMKGYKTFLDAIKHFTAGGDKPVHFVSVGGGCQPYMDETIAYSRELGIEKYITWLGSRDDLPNIYNSLDIFTLCSDGEGFSNAIGEAMACELPCVVTDVGDSKIIVGDTGIVIHPGDARALSEAWDKLLAADRESIGKRARERIIECFSLKKLADRTEEILINA